MEGVHELEAAWELFQLTVELVESSLVSLPPSMVGCLAVMVVVARGEREQIGGDSGWVVG